jgi:2-(1,2-epoxy-1,2-dihydrophenyl)acetyl-CoA isomerase
VDAVLTDLRDGVMTITLNRPDRFNAVNLDLVEGLADACSEVVSSGARAVVLTGSGRGFCAGADLKEGNASPEPASRRMRARYMPTFLQLASLPVPVVAAVNGAVAGAGLSVAGAADIRIVSDSAFFVSGFVDVGLAPDTGASYFLERAVGYSNALLFLCAGRRMGAEEALRLGLANEVVPAEDLMNTATQLAAQLAAKPGRGVEFTKRLLDQARGNSLASQLEAESRAYDVTSIDPGRTAARQAEVRRLSEGKRSH